MSNLSKSRSIREDSTSTDHLKRLLSSGEYSDLIATVGQEDDGKRVFQIHKNIVATQSGYFQKLCNSCFPESATNEVTIPEIEAPIFEHVLSYLYTNTYKGSDIVADSKVFVAADYFDIPGLRRISLDRIVSAVGFKKTFSSTKSKDLRYKSQALTDLQQGDFIEALTNLLSASQNIELVNSKLMNVVAKRFYELRDKESFKTLLEAHNTFAIGLLYRVFNMTTGGCSSSNKVELWCDVCKILTRSSWVCGNTLCRKQRGKMEIFSNYKEECACGAEFTTLRCIDCKERRYPYKFHHS